MRKPKVINKYNLVPKDIQRAIILKPEKIKENPFWRNNAINAYCLSENTAKIIEIMNLVHIMNIGSAFMMKTRNHMLERLDLVVLLMAECVVINLKSFLILRKLSVKLI